MYLRGYGSRCNHFTTGSWECSSKNGTGSATEWDILRLYITLRHEVLGISNSFGVLLFADVLEHINRRGQVPACC